MIQAIKNPKIGDIEVLRGLAVLGVIVFHSYLFPLHLYFPWFSPLFSWWGSWTGVDLFFAISGFVIARALLPLFQSCTDWRSFWIVACSFWLRRMWRLWPASWLCLAIIYLLSVFFNQTHVFGSVESNAWSTLAGVGNYANFWLMHHFENYGGSAIFWSLSLEDQFYLALPILAFIFRRHLSVILVLAVIAQAFSRRDLATVLYRTDAILLGVLIAIWQTHDSWKRAGKVVANLPVGLLRTCILLLVILLGILGGKVGGALHMQYTFIAIVSAALVFIAAQDKNYLLPSGAIRAILTWIGERSYLLYLTHQFCMFFAFEALDRLGNTTNGTLACVIWFCSMLSLTQLIHYWVEIPAREFGARQATKFRLRFGSAPQAIDVGSIRQ